MKYDKTLIYIFVFLCWNCDYINHISFNRNCYKKSLPDCFSLCLWLVFLLTGGFSPWIGWNTAEHWRYSSAILSSMCMRGSSRIIHPDNPHSPELIWFYLFSIFCCHNSYSVAWLMKEKCPENILSCMRTTSWENCSFTKCCFSAQEATNMSDKCFSLTLRFKNIKWCPEEMCLPSPCCWR